MNKGLADPRKLLPWRTMFLPLKPLSNRQMGGPPFHPQCSKTTAPFVEALASGEELAAGEPDPDTDRLLNVRDRSTLQQRFQSMNMGKIVRERSKTVQPVASSKIVISDRDDAKRLESYARQFGVEKVDLQGRSDIGIPVVRGLQQAVSAGMAVPKSIVVDSNRFVDKYGRVDPGSVAYFAYRAGATEGNIYINPQWPGWKNIEQTMRDRYRRGLLSSDDPRHVMLHELAHCDFTSRRLDHRNAPFRSIQDRTLAGRVSLRATANKDEFLAEVTAARLVGKKFDEDVMALYRRLTNAT